MITILCSVTVHQSYGNNIFAVSMFTHHVREIILNGGNTIDLDNNTLASTHVTVNIHNYSTTFMTFCDEYSPALQTS